MKNIILVLVCCFAGCGILSNDSIFVSVDKNATICDYVFVEYGKDNNYYVMGKGDTTTLEAPVRIKYRRFCLDGYDIDTVVTEGSVLILYDLQVKK